MKIEFLNEAGDFLVRDADDTSYLYFPLANEGGMMSAVSPTLTGDAKTGQNSFLMAPASVEDLHTSLLGRTFWLVTENGTAWNVSGTSAAQKAAKYTADKDTVTAEMGKLWHKVTRENRLLGIRAEVLSFVPAGTERAEIMQVTITDIGEGKLAFTPTVAVPIYGRSADNIRDHRHVTSLLHRTRVLPNGIEVTPTLSFDERGHQINHVTYGVYAEGPDGEKPVRFYPVQQEYIGEGGTMDWPQAVVLPEDKQGAAGVRAFYPGDEIAGYETVGAMTFPFVTLEPGESRTYEVVMSLDGEGRSFLDPEKTADALAETKLWWEKAGNVAVKTSDPAFDQWMSWVGIQPTLRRLFGCSFLPHHDYGRGGRGWRDLWQDSLSLLLMDPAAVRPMLVSYFDGVRMDGTNATIIGSVPGEFKADRNAIVRVWMDHGLWPLITVNQYLGMTGDYEILSEEGTYFKDQVAMRGDGADEAWDGVTGVQQDKDGKVLKASVLERILLQQLAEFYDVGAHGHMRLRGADWNDALDMAKENGESVAFTAAYSGNFRTLAEIFTALDAKGVKEVSLTAELLPLVTADVSAYDSADEKRKILADYCASVRHTVAGTKKAVKTADLARDMAGKADWLQKHLRETELVGDGEGNRWFNSYYDNSGRQTDGVAEGKVRMMLTGQVFPVMSGTATDDQVAAIVRAADRYLFDEGAGGYRLNTDFGELKTDLGRQFGFAYGHKENGAVFSHMDVMFAYSLYSRGFGAEGFRTIKSLYRQGMKTGTARIYPGIPEYFSDRGRGMYHYLTGAASWLVLTVLSEMFGIRGEAGDLVLKPQLMPEQFDEQGEASVSFVFADRSLTVVYENPEKKAGAAPESFSVDGTMIEGGRVSAELLASLPAGETSEIRVKLT